MYVCLHIRASAASQPELLKDLLLLFVLLKHFSLLLLYLSAASSAACCTLANFTYRLCRLLAHSSEERTFIQANWQTHSSVQAYVCTHVWRRVNCIKNILKRNTEMQVCAFIYIKVLALSTLKKCYSYISCNVVVVCYQSIKAPSDMRKIQI